jgi:hypothetical protein
MPDLYAMSRKAGIAVNRAESDLADAVSVARAEGFSWTAIGIMLGTTANGAEEWFGRR